MAIIETTTRSGSKKTSTLSGNIQIDESTGELLVRHGSVVLTRVNSDGFTYTDPVSGVRRVRMGINPADSSVGLYISKPGVDVIDELES